MTESAPRDLPNGWKQTRLGDVAREFLNGGTPSTKVPKYWDGEIAWTTSAPISASDIFLSQGQRQITEDGLRNSSTHLVPKGNFVVGTRVGVGKAVVNIIDIAISQDLTGVVLDTNKVSPEFLAFQYKSASIQQFVESRKRGVTIQGITRADLAELPLRLPSFPEQRAIAHALHTVQQARAARQGELTLERERKAALMEHLFTHGTRGEPRKQTEIGEMPESWRVVRLGEVFRFTKKRENLRYSDYKSIPFVPMELIPIDRLLFDDFILKPISELTSGTYFEPGDVLLSKITPSFENGKQGIIENLPTPFGVATTEVIPIQGVANVSERIYLFYYLLQRQVRLMLAAKMEGSTGRQRLSKANVANLEMRLPSLDEQRVIASTLRACDAKIAALKRETQVLDELFRAMLDELMTGKLSTGSLIQPVAQKG